MADVIFTSYAFPATGAPTGRTLPSRLGINVKNVKDFGALGDGVTNDQPSIQAAADAVWKNNLGNVDTGCVGTVYFPPGTYFVSAPITIQAPTAIECNFVFRGVGAASKITGNVNGGIIQRFYSGGGPGSAPVLIENLWINQDGTSDDDGMLTTPGSHCIYITDSSGVQVRYCKLTTKKHGIAIANVQGWSVYGCDLVCTGVTTPRWGIMTGANGTVGTCHVEGFTSGIRNAEIGGTIESCVFKNNTIGIEPSKSYPANTRKNLTLCSIISCYFEGNDSAIYNTEGTTDFCLIAANTIVGTGSSSYGLRSGQEYPGHAVIAGNVVSGTFSTAGITTPAQVGKGASSFLGTSSVNSGAGVAWGEAQGNNGFSNTYTNCPGFTGHPARMVFSGLPDGSGGNRVEGDTYNITNSTTAAWGVPCAPGGSNHVKVRWNGVDWTVVGK